MPIQIKNEQTVSYFVSLIEPVVEKPAQLSSQWLTKRKWAAIPIPDSFNEIDAKRIAKTARQYGYSTGIAVSTELGEASEVYKIKFTKNDLLTFDSQFSLSNFLITTEDLAFVIMKEAGYYFIIAGKSDFVSRVVGDTFVKTRAKFKEYAEDADWPIKTRKALIEIAERYQGFDGG